VNENEFCGLSAGVSDWHKAPVHAVVALGVIDDLPNSRRKATHFIKHMVLFHHEIAE
jgi:hypothetical protein